MAQNDKIQLFENKRIRTAWDEEKEEWYFSIVDVVAVLTDQPDQRGASNYWAKLKQRLKEEGADQLLTNCQQLKMKSPKDGKRYNTDVADTEQLLRIIQSIPSPKAEPFKLWLAQVGRERIEETIDPELTIERALETYLKKGYTREWINQRLQAIQVRKELTDEWDARGVQKGVEYAILTDEICQGMDRGCRIESRRRFLYGDTDRFCQGGQSRFNPMRRQVFLPFPHQQRTGPFLCTRDLDDPVVPQKSPDLTDDERYRICRKRVAAGHVKAADRLEHSNRADLTEILIFHAASNEPMRDPPDQSGICLHQMGFCRFVSLCRPCEIICVVLIRCFFRRFHPVRLLCA